MQAVGPYRLLGALGTCAVGGVWAAVDPAGQRLTVAILNEAASKNAGWREAFTAAARALSEAPEDALPVVDADYTGPRPWVACAEEQGPGAGQIFLALGLQYQQGTGPQPVPAGPPAPVEPEPGTPVPVGPVAVPVQASPDAEAPAAPPTEILRKPSAPEPAEPADGEPVPETVPLPSMAAPAEHRPEPPPVEEDSSPWAPPTVPLGDLAPRAEPDKVVAAAAVVSPSPAVPAEAPHSAPPVQSAPPFQGSAPVQSAPPARPGPPVHSGPVSPPIQPGPPMWSGPPLHASASASVPISAPPRAPIQAGPPQVGPPQVGPPQVGPPQVGPPQVGPPQMVPHQPGPPRPAPPQPPMPRPMSGPPISAAPSSPYAYPGPLATPPKKGRRSGLLLTVIAVVALLVGAGGGAAGMYLYGKPKSAVTTTAPTASPDIRLPTAAPAQPGQEPPMGGGWPSEWPEFKSTDNTKTMDKLAGLGFSFRVPPDWDCTEVERTTGYVKYTCGKDPDVGGDLIVRECPRPCTEDRRVEMRMSEEAWGVKWTRSGPFTTWGETDQAGGAARYGLVYISYWRSTPEDAVDRQLVFRMTATPQRVDELRKVVNSIRETTFTI